MSLRSLVPVSVFFCLAAMPAFAQQTSKDSPPPAHDVTKGASLMAEARKALGGEDKLAAIKRLEVKGSSTQVTAQQTLEGDLTMQIEAQIGRASCRERG